MEWINTLDLLRALGVPDDLMSMRGDVCNAILKRARAPDGLMRATAAMIYMGDSCERNADVPREFWEHVPEQDWVRGDFTAWIKVKRGGLYPQERQVQVRMFGVRFAKSDAEAMGADFTFADPAVMSGSVMAAEPNPQSMEDRYRQLAKELDDEGMPIRSVSVKTIQARWSSADGPAPLVKTVTGYMDGGGRGGRPKGG